ncbi:MAG: hypothetical protein IJC71_05925 [Clostridia bacterium]|nr:hypothetical protein [Clostridia bacterium]
MNDKVFLRLLFAVLAVCAIATVLHLCWAVYAYQNCSIIYFIGKELW